MLFVLSPFFDSFVSLELDTIVEDLLAVNAYSGRAAKHGRGLVNTTKTSRASSGRGAPGGNYSLNQSRKDNIRLRKFTLRRYATCIWNCSGRTINQDESLQVAPERFDGMKKSAFKIVGIALTAIIVSSIGWAADTGKIVVMNPQGVKPEIRKIPMATRPATLDGQTIYIVDIKYPNTQPFVDEMYAALKERYPKTNWVVKEKLGGYMDDDPDLWKETKEKAAGAIVLVGH
jgi:hypothetical protein